MSVTDRDLGLGRIMAAAKRFRRRLKVGVFDPEVARYGTIHEMQTRWMRQTFDERQSTVDRELQDLHDAAAAGEDPGPMQLQIAEGYAQAYRDAIGAEDLVETGALRGSIEVRDERGQGDQ